MSSVLVDAIQASRVLCVPLVCVVLGGAMVTLLTEEAAAEEFCDCTYTPVPQVRVSETFSVGTFDS